MENLCFDNADKYLQMQNGKIIHQIWFGNIPDKKTATKAFEGLRKYRDSWILKNPSWTYMCWGLDKCYELVKNYYPQHLEMYNKYPYQIQRCDTVRYFILHRYGGLYADMDYVCNRSWNEVIDSYDIYSLYLVETPNKMGDEMHISNSLMYSSPGHILWSKLFIELEKHKTMPVYYGRHATIMFTTGPGILNRVYNKNKIKDKLGYYPYKLFHPHGINSEILTLNSKPEIYAMHLGKGSWESSDSKIIIFLYQEYKMLLIVAAILIFPSLIYWLCSRKKMISANKLEFK